jgi:hypothetical protein
MQFRNDKRNQSFSPHVRCESASAVLVVELVVDFVHVPRERPQRSAALVALHSVVTALSALGVVLPRQQGSTHAQCNRHRPQTAPPRRRQRRAQPQTRTQASGRTSTDHPQGCTQGLPRTGTIMLQDTTCSAVHSHKQARRRQEEPPQHTRNAKDWCHYA